MDSDHKTVIAQGWSQLALQMDQLQKRAYGTSNASIRIQHIHITEYYMPEIVFGSFPCLLRALFSS